MRTRAVLVGTGVAVAALGAVFLAVGLGTADQVASTVGALAGVAGLGFSVLSWANGRNGPSTPGPSAPGPSTPGPSRRGEPRMTVQGGQFGNRNHQENTFVSGPAWSRRRRDDD
jgi:hypothetical protein